MDLYTDAELDAIEADPKRRHVRMLVAEVKRLNEIARAAEQYVNPNMVGGDVQRRIGLQHLLDGPRSTTDI